jgi:hypothetical protein
MSNQVRHAMSYPYEPRPQLMHRPIPHTEFGIRNLEIRNPLAPRMERENGAVESGPITSILAS